METSQSLSNFHQCFVNFHCYFATLHAEQCFSMAAAHLVHSLEAGIERHPRTVSPRLLDRVVNQLPCFW